jgi:hypothetical protein
LAKEALKKVRIFFFFLLTALLFCEFLMASAMISSFRDGRFSKKIRRRLKNFFLLNFLGIVRKQPVVSTTATPVDKIRN